MYPEGEDRCYLGSTRFWSSNDQLVAASELQEYDLVRSAGGESIRVMSVRELPLEDRTLVTLIAPDNATTTVTTDHRVMVARGHGFQHAPAGSLRRGDIVLL